MKITMNLSKKTLKNIAFLSNAIGGADRTRTVAVSLVISKIIVDEISLGNRIIIKDANGDEREVKFVLS